jgi:hypothetical protein
MSRNTVTVLIYHSHNLIDLRYSNISKIKKSYPCTGRGGPWGCERLRFPHLKHSAHRWQQGCQPYVQPLFTPRKIPGTYFC